MRFFFYILSISLLISLCNSTLCESLTYSYNESQALSSCISSCECNSTRICINHKCTDNIPIAYRRGGRGGRSSSRSRSSRSRSRASFSRRGRSYGTSNTTSSGKGSTVLAIIFFVIFGICIIGYLVYYYIQASEQRERNKRILNRKASRKMYKEIN